MGLVSEGLHSGVALRDCPVLLHSSDSKNRSTDLNGVTVTSLGTKQET